MTRIENALVHESRHRATLGPLAVCALAACTSETLEFTPPRCPAGLQPGDLVITEIMANPPGPDAGREWFELYNAREFDADLQGAVLRLGRAGFDGERLHAIEALTVEPGAYAVLGDADPAATPTPLDYAYGDGLGSTGFPNADGELAIGCGDVEVDAVTYGDVAEGHSRGLDGSHRPHAEANDDPRLWCSGSSELDPGQFGTPGAPNDPCFSPTPSSCREGGSMRALVPPKPGDLVITEVMPDPAAVGDAEGEWFELFVAAEVDLNGLTLTKLGDEDASDRVNAVECAGFARGSYALFAHRAAPEANGGLPTVDQLFTLTLPNSAPETTGFSIGWGGRELDAAVWTRSRAGVSMQLHAGRLEPSSASPPKTFCESRAPYGHGDLGSPRAPNGPCPPPSGHCVAADGSFRPVRPPELGDLWITEFMADPTAVGDPEGEWFELLTHAGFDLNALQFGRTAEAEQTVDLERCTPVEAGQRLVFSRNPDATTNGGLPDVAYPLDLALPQTDGRLIVTAQGRVLDAVAWSRTTPGTSRALDPGVSGPDANDREENWCNSTTAYGNGDLGTPSAANLPCSDGAASRCDEAGRPRDLLEPSPGDLVITEWMPDPSAVADARGEWFEIVVHTDVDLNGIQLGNDPRGTWSEPAVPWEGPCVAAAAGSRLVFARDRGPAANGGLDDAFATFDFGLPNRDGRLFVGFDDTIIDSVAYATSTPGASTSVLPGFEDADLNDEDAHRCTSDTAYGEGDLGTPGQPNACASRRARP